MAEKKSNREMIIENAILLFYERGFERTTMRLIAEESSITHPAIFNHFKSKADIASILIYRFFRGVVRTTERYIEDKKLSRDDDRTLFFYWTAHFYYCKTDTNFFRFMNEFSNSYRSDFDSVENDYFTQIFRNLMHWNYNKSDVEYRIYSSLLNAASNILGHAVSTGEISLAKAVEEISNIVYAIVRLERPASGGDIENFVRSLDTGKYLGYSVLEDFLLTDFGELYDEITTDLFR
ncbi:MAG: TetR/AcrR family transcriptional regulator [Eubacteriaceae bacterium]|nr:TetR/AcrR family transcriptional regulator [Eubacteriaceae bacterium]